MIAERHIAVFHDKIVNKIRNYSLEQVSGDLQLVKSLSSPEGNWAV